MADISVWVAPNNTEYNLKDATARSGLTGKVSGPSSSTNLHVAVFDGTTGKAIKDSGYTIGKSVPSDAVFTDTTYGVATTSANGLMSSTDKSKLNGIASGATANTGTVTSVVAGSGLSGGTITTSGTISLANHSADYIVGGYLNIHPENSPTLIPMVNNDIAFLLKRGGSAVVKYDSTTQSIDLTNVFDGSPSYWAINPTGVTNIIIELTLHKQFTWTNTIYVDFGSASWRAKTIKIEVMNSNYSGDTWTQKASVTNHGTGHYYIAMSHTPSGASNAGGGFNKIRFTFGGWATSTIFRIAALGIYNYGSSGQRETFVPRDGGYVYGTLYPFTTNGADLGTSSRYWSNAYITKLNGVAVGSSPKFTDTTYSSKTAASGGTDVSLVTTGEKYTWNNMRQVPAVSTSDNGKVLRVVSGAWAAVSLPSASGVSF